MISWSDYLYDDPTDWLLEEENPSVRYLALRTIMERPEEHPEAVAAKQAIMGSGPVPAILAAQHEDGYWVKPGTGYRPKYQGTIWQLMFLAQLGADGSDERVARACEYVLGHSRDKNGAFSVTGVPSAAIECLNGNLIHALYRLGWGGDERVQEAVQQLCALITRRHFQCSGNYNLPCAWGAVKALFGFSAIPKEERTERGEGSDSRERRFPAQPQSRRRRLPVPGADQLELVQVRLPAELREQRSGSASSAGRLWATAPRRGSPTP